MGALGAWALLPLGAGAQAPVRTETTGGRAAVANDLAVPIIALVTDTGAAVRTFRSVVVGPRSRSDVPDLGASALLWRFEPVSATIGLRAAPPAPCSSDRTGSLGDAIATLQRDLEAPGLEGSAEAERAVELASQLAQLKLDRIRDSVDASRNSMTALTLRMQASRDASPMVLAKQRDADAQESVRQTAEDIANLGLAYADAAEAKYDVLRRDADHYKELLGKGESTLVKVREQMGRLSTIVAGQAEFGGRLVELAERGGSGGGATLTPTAPARRVCAEAADVEDAIELRLAGDDRSATSVAEAVFDSGERQVMLLRRIRGTDQWRGALAWPNRATAARLRIRPVGSAEWREVPGAVRPNRQSLAALEGQLARDVERARKRFKEATFRAEGADHVKTVVVP